MQTFQKGVRALLVAGALIHSCANASLRIDEPVSLGLPVDGGQGSLTGYRVEGTCTNWYYLPAYLMADIVSQGTDTGSATIKETTYNTYVLSTELRIQPVKSDRDVEALKELIVKTLKETEGCTDGKFQTSDIALNALYVKSDSDFRTVKTVSTGVSSPALNIGTSFQAVFVPGDTSTAGVFRDPFVVGSVTEILDASDPDSARFWKDKASSSKSGPVKLTEITYKVEGIQGVVNSKIIVKSDMKATFQSALQNVGCHSENSSNGLGGLGTISLGIPGGISNDKKSMTCDYQLLTNLVNGSADIGVVFDHSGSRFTHKDKKGVETDIIVDVYDDKGESHAMTLRDYVQLELIMELSFGNFATTMDEAGKVFWAPDKGKQGQGDLTVNGSAQYKLDFYGETEIAVPILATNIDSANIDSAYQADDYYKCLVKNYRAQAKTFAKNVGVTPIPVSDLCADGGGAQ